MTVYDLPGPLHPPFEPPDPWQVWRFVMPNGDTASTRARFNGADLVWLETVVEYESARTIYRHLHRNGDLDIRTNLFDIDVARVETVSFTLDGSGHHPTMGDAIHIPVNGVGCLAEPPERLGQEVEFRAAEANRHNAECAEVVRVMLESFGSSRWPGVGPLIRVPDGTREWDLLAVTGSKEWAAERVRLEPAYPSAFQLLSVPGTAAFVGHSERGVTLFWGNEEAAREIVTRRQPTPPSKTAPEPPPRP